MTVKFRHHSANEFTGDTAISLDRFVTATMIADSEVHYAWVALLSTNKIYLYVFNKTSTEATSSPDYIRNADYATAGVWELMDSPFDVSAGIETGSVITVASDTVPSGYLECDGSTISRTTYSDLFTAISDLYGVGDGVNTFEIPDYRGMFLRAWDNSAGIDPDAATRIDSGDGSTTGDNVGTRQAEGVLSHTHSVRDGNGSTHGITSGSDQSVPTAAYGSSGGYGGNETRPVNVNVMLCIKI